MAQSVSTDLHAAVAADMANLQPATSCASPFAPLTEDASPTCVVSLSGRTEWWRWLSVGAARATATRAVGDERSLCGCALLRCGSECERGRVGWWRPYPLAPSHRGVMWLLTAGLCFCACLERLLHVAKAHLGDP